MRKIVYDISVLGIGHHHPASRAGVFRVTERLAKELVKTDQFQLSFSAVTGLTTFYNAKEYLKDSSDCFSRISLLDLSGLPPFLKPQIDNLNRISVLFEPVLSQKSLSEVDIFHSPYFPIPKQIKKEKRIKTFLTIYDLIPQLFPQYVGKRIKLGYNKILKSIDGNMNLFCISYATKNDLCNYLPQVDPARVTVTHLAASNHFYPAKENQILEVRKKYRLPEGDYFLTLSTLEPRKNLDHAVRCFTKLLNEKALGTDVNLVLAGTKGWLNTNLYKEISKSKYKDRIFLTGYIADEDLAPLYSGAIGFVYPSIYEGFGLPPLEAMQCGVPVITSNTSSLPEVVGDAGIMVSPRDTHALCQAMLTLYKNGEVRKKMSDKSIQRAKQFSWERCGKETLAAYQKAV